MMKALVIAILLGMSASVVSAQVGEDRQTPNTLRLTPGAQQPAATLTDMAWLVGRWKGTGLGGVSEEIWADPVGGVMMGMYRLVINGKPSFYEFMHLSEEQGSLVLELKHFNSDLTGWEEKDRFVTFPLVKLGAKEAIRLESLEPLVSNVLRVLATDDRPGFASLQETRPATDHLESRQ